STAAAAAMASDGDVRTARELLGMVLSLLWWSVTGRALVRGPFVVGFRPIILSGRRHAPHHFAEEEKTMADQTLRFGASGDALRSEDEPLLAGRGRFTDDLAPSGAAHAALVRAPIGHGVLKSVDLAAAARMPGVLAIFTGDDLVRDGVGAIPPAVLLPGRGGKQMFGGARRVSAGGRVRCGGGPVAIVVAETPAQAQDAAEAVVLDLRELPAVSDVERATASGAPAIWDEAPGNICLDWEDGDARAVAAAFASAAQIARVRLVHPPAPV